MFTSLVFFKISIARSKPFPFAVSVSHSYNTTEKIRLFSVHLSVSADKESLKYVVINFTLPPEVDLKEGKLGSYKIKNYKRSSYRVEKIILEKEELNWSGDIKPYSGQSLKVSIRSKTDRKEWSEPIRAHVEFIYKQPSMIKQFKEIYGEWIEWKIYHDFSWSHDSYKHIKTEWEKKKGVWKKKMEIDCNKKGNRLLCY